MSITTAKRMAQIEWGGYLDQESFQVLDERLGIVACRVVRRGAYQPMLYWNGISFPLTEQMIDDLSLWKEATKQRKD